jgi:Adenine-specific DNA methylase containing a Zn-ribbon
VPDTELPEAALGFRVQGYGMTRHADLFTPRQLTALTTFSDLVKEARDKVLADALAAGMPEGDRLEAGGTHAAAYADAVTTYLGLAASRFANFMNALCQWRPDAGKEQVGHLFIRQAIPMAWDAAEANPWSSAAGSWDQNILFIPKVLSRLMLRSASRAQQSDAGTRS